LKPIELLLLDELSLDELKACPAGASCADTAPTLMTLAMIKTTNFLTSTSTKIEKKALALLTAI
jgi:hypothetical protein